LSSYLRNFGFSEFAAKTFTEFRPSLVLKEEEDADAHRRIVRRLKKWQINSDGDLDVLQDELNQLSTDFRSFAGDCGTLEN
jgi:hypothetical protein